MAILKADAAKNMAMDLDLGSRSVAADAELPAALASTPAEASATLDKPKRASSEWLFWCCLALLIAFGVLGLAPALMNLWDIWTNDPLRSIGMLIVPASVILTLRVWRERGWELRGSWWGLLPLALAFLSGDFRQRFAWFFTAGPVKVDFFAPKISLCLFACGVVLLFAGARVWRQAWFPLALLLFAQPVPAISERILDLPLQNISAHAARSFAGWIGFAPSKSELLRLMFTPDFGMFIAPGCDGLRGAVTLGYGSLIVGYLKRVSFSIWFLFVSGAVLLGYLFNLIRLCALVLYYRIAVGHPWLEHVAKQADYVIGGCLILVAAALFLWAVRRKEGTRGAIQEPSQPYAAVSPQDRRATYFKAAAFAVPALLFIVPGVLALRGHQKSFAQTVRDGDLTPAQLDGLMPPQIGDYKLSRAWQQEMNGRVDLESAVYAAPGSSEITLGVWLPPSQHTMHDSWKARGEDPEMRGNSSFTTAQGRTVPFDTAYYSDGITDSFAGNVLCTPSSCSPSYGEDGVRFVFAVNPLDFKTRGVRAVPIFFRVDRPHTDAPKAAIREALSAEAQRFLAGVDFFQLSQKFQ